MNWWITDPEVDSRLSGVSASLLFVALPEEYMIRIFWEMTSGFSFSALLGSTVDTYSASVYGCFWKNLMFLCAGEPGSRGRFSRLGSHMEIWALFQQAALMTLKMCFLP